MVEDAGNLSVALVNGGVAGDYVAYEANAHYTPLPLALVDMLPTLAARLPQVPQARAILADGVKRAVEALCQHSFAEFIKTQIRQNYAAWLFVTELQPKIGNESEWRLILAGLEDHDCWRWEASAAERADVFRRLLSAAKDTSWPVNIVRDAWANMQARTRKNIKASLEKEKASLLATEQACRVKQGEIKKLTRALDVLNETTL